MYPIHTLTIKRIKEKSTGSVFSSCHVPSWSSLKRALGMLLQKAEIGLKAVGNNKENIITDKRNRSSNFTKCNLFQFWHAASKVLLKAVRWTAPSSNVHKHHLLGRGTYSWTEHTTCWNEVPPLELNTPPAGMRYLLLNWTHHLLEWGTSSWTEHITCWNKVSTLELNTPPPGMRYLLLNWTHHMLEWGTYSWTEQTT